MTDNKRNQQDQESSTLLSSFNDTPITSLSIDNERPVKEKEKAEVLAGEQSSDLLKSLESNTAVIKENIGKSIDVIDKAIKDKEVAQIQNIKELGQFFVKMFRILFIIFTAIVSCLAVTYACYIMEDKDQLENLLKIVYVEITSFFESNGVLLAAVVGLVIGNTASNKSKK